MNSSDILSSLLTDAVSDLRETADAMDLLRDDMVGLLWDDMPAQTRKNAEALLGEIDKLWTRLRGYACDADAECEPVEIPPDDFDSDLIP